MILIENKEYDAKFNQLRGQIGIKTVEMPIYWRFSADYFLNHGGWLQSMPSPHFTLVIGYCIT